MAITQNTFTGNGSNLGPFSFTFQWLESTDIKVTVAGVLKTAGTHYNLQSLNYATKTGGQVLFTAGNAPANGAAIVIYRQTDDTDLVSTFYSGSAIRAQDLNNNFTQGLYVTQEANNNVVTSNATANTALTTANTALSNSTTAVSTANTASSNASAAVATANTANTNASAAVSTANTASSNASAAVSTANTASSNASTALSTANTALSTANTASTNASAAITTANSAASSASAAVSTANTAASNAASAVSTANTANTAAGNAVTTANTAATNASAALSASTTASSNASAAVSTANTAATNASAAVTTANTASTNASTALSTANTALSTANTASTNASAAVTTANSASSTASGAVTTANTANSKADQAIAAVSSSINYTLVTNVAGIPASPANDTYVEVGNSTGIESFTPLAGMPAGFVGDSGLSVRMRYTTAGATWNWQNYYPNNAETRYLKLGSTGTVTTGMIANGTIVDEDIAAGATIAGSKITPNFGSNTLAAGGATFSGNVTAPALIPSGSTAPSLGLYTPSAGSVAISTSGAGRLFVDASGNINLGQASSALQSNGTGLTVYGASSSEIKFLNSSTGSAATDGTALVATGAAFTINNREAGPIILSTSNSERLRITDGGLVGVGTSFPQTGILDLTRNGTAGTISSYRQLRIGLDPSAGYAGFIGYGFPVAGQSAALILESVDNGAPSNTIINPSGGRVGIGTSSPEAVGHFHTATSGGNMIQISTATSGSTSSDGGVIGLDAANKLYLYNRESGSIELGTSNASRLLIDSSGRVGIGTTSPGALLHLAGNADQRFTNATNTAGFDIGLLGGTGSADSYVYNRANAALIFGTNNAERVRVSNAGQLLVGTSTADSTYILGGGSLTPAVQFNSANVGLSVNRTDDGAVVFLSNSNNISTADREYGRISFNGSNGSGNLRSGAWIQAFADAATGTNDMPGRLVFSTTSDNSASPSERVRISSTGAIGLSGANYGTSGQVLTSSGSGAAPTWQTPTGVSLGLAIALG